MKKTQANDNTADTATGISQRMPAGGPFYSDYGEKITDARARRLLRAGAAVEAPNAGAGSYRAIAARLGFSSLQVEDWTSSAGDWCFRLRGGRFLFQENRYPYNGFRYSIGRGF